VTIRRVPGPEELKSRRIRFGLVGCGSISDSIDGLSKSVSNGFNSISDSSRQSSDSSSGETKAAE